MLAVLRHKKILDLLASNGAVKVSELSALMQVTEKTVREDLEKLEQKGLLRRIHGGAVPLEDTAAVNYPPAYPNTANLHEKRAIAANASTWINDGDVIALDGGSTTLEIAKTLGNRRLTVVTNDVMIIRELAMNEDIRLVVPGGYRHSNMLVTKQSLDWVRGLNIQKLFLSTTGIHLEYGFSIFTEELLEQKQALIEAAKRVICVADHGKFDKGALLTFAELNIADAIITDDGLPEQIAEKYRTHGVQVISAPSL